MATWADLLNYKQYVVRSDGAKFRDGVRDDNLDTSWLGITSQEVHLGPGMYDELLILPRAATDEEIQRWYELQAPFYDPAPVITEGQIVGADKWNQAFADAQQALVDATAKANAAEAAAKDASLSKSVYLTPGKTTIDGGQITTHSIATEAIKIGSTINMINNFSESNHLKGWSNYGSSTLVQEIQKDGRVVRTLKTVTTGNMQIQSDYIEVDPTATYEIRLSIYSAHADATGTRYFGMHAYDENFINIGVIPFSVSNRTFGTTTANPYFWSGDVYGGNWRDMTGYVLGCNVVEDEAPVGKNVSSHFKLPPDARYIAVRFLNYYNEGVSVRNDFYSPSITRVGTTIISGDQITTGILDAKRVNVIDLNAANITTGKLNANNVTVEAKGASGRVDITSEGIWARNSSGVAQAGFDVTGRFMAGNNQIIADAIGLRVASGNFSITGTEMVAKYNNQQTFRLDFTTGDAWFKGEIEADAIILPIRPY